MKEGRALYFIRQIGISVGGGILTLAILLAASSAVALGTGDPEPLMLPLSLTSLAVSCLITGALAARLCGDTFPYLISSLSASALLVLLQLSAGLFFQADDNVLTTGLRILVYCSMLILGMLGGILGRPRLRKVRRHIKRKRR